MLSNACKSWHTKSGEGWAGEPAALWVRAARLAEHPRGCFGTTGQPEECACLFGSRPQRFGSRPSPREPRTCGVEKNDVRMHCWALFDTFASPDTEASKWWSNLVDPASSYMLVSKTKPYGETTNSSLLPGFQKEMRKEKKKKQKADKKEMKKSHPQKELQDKQNSGSKGRSGKTRRKKARTEQKQTTDPAPQTLDPICPDRLNPRRAYRQLADHEPADHAQNMSIRLRWARPYN